MASLPQIIIFAGVLFLWFYIIGQFLEKGDITKRKNKKDHLEEEKEPLSDVESDPGSADNDASQDENAPEPERRRPGRNAARNQGEEDKLDKEEIDNNMNIRHLEK